MKRLVTLLSIVFVLALLVAPVAAQDPVTVTWFVGLGTGTSEPQIEVQQQIVEEYNASHTDIQIELILAASNAVAPDTLSTLIAGGTPPDIIGPVGFSGANLFAGQWLDLQPLVDAAGYDMSIYPEALANLYRNADGTLDGIPFAVFPSMIYVNKDLFDEAGLNYPPSEYGQPYIWEDGTEVEWNWDTVAELAQILTVDASGNDATMEEFDATAVEQFGFNQQWGSLRTDMSVFGGHPFWNSETGEVTISDAWRANLEWTWKGIWEDNFIPTASYDSSQLFTPSAFASGRVAMARAPLWYTCCVGELQAIWDLAPMPSYNGEYFSPVDADTYRIHATSDTPTEAFEVVQYLQGEAAGRLLVTYGAFPAVPELQEAAIADKAAAFPTVTNWDLVPASLAYAAVPNHESWNPNFPRTQQRFNDLRTLLYGDTGADIDLNAEIDTLIADLQTIIDEAE